MTPIRVRVTQEMIDVAVQSDRHRCAVVLGLKFSDDDLERIDVKQDYIRVSSRSEQLRYWWRTPKQVRRHIDQFDLDKSELHPFSFTLDPEQAMKVKPVFRQGAAQMAKRNARPRSTGRGQSTAARPPQLAA